MAESLSQDNVIEQLLDRVPEIRPLYRQQLEEEGSPPIPFLFLPYVVKFAYELCRKRAQTSRDSLQCEDILRRLMSYLEDGLSGHDPYVRDFIGTGFIEIMDPDDPCFPYLKSLMGPLARQDVEKCFGPEWHRRIQPPHQ